MDEITKQFMDYLKDEMVGTKEETKNRMLEIAYILIFLYLQNTPQSLGYTFRFENSANIIFENLRKDLYNILKLHTDNAYKLSVLKNEKLLGVKIEPKIAGWLNRKIQDKTIKQRIFEYTQMFKMEMEANISLGIVNKETPQSLLMQVKKYLSNPYDNLNVKTKADFKARRLAIKYNRGVGKYTSAYNNLERLSIEEVMQTYRRTDYLIWSKSNRVKGILISLNPAHPKVDICDSLVGVYPKTYFFTGFHPRCICLSTPLITGKTIKNIPTQAKTYMANEKNIKWYGKLPFYSENKKFFN